MAQSLYGARPDAIVASTMYTLRCLTYSALAFHVWDWFSGIPFEIKHIWRREPSLPAVRWQYIISRYFGIVIQIANTVTTAYIHESYAAPRSLCVLWALGQLIAGQCILLSLEASLIMRIFALYDTNYRVASGLCLLVLAEHIIMATCGIIAFRQLDLNEACITARTPKIGFCIAFAVGITQGLLCTLVLVKIGHRHIPLLSLLIRDSSWVFAIVLILLVTSMTNIVVSPRPVINPFPVFVAVVTFSNCRIIMNLEAMPQKGEQSSIIEFTTFFEEEGERSRLSEWST